MILLYNFSSTTSYFWLVLIVDEVDHAVKLKCILILVAVAMVIRPAVIQHMFIKNVHIFILDGFLIFLPLAY